MSWKHGTTDGWRYGASGWKMGWKVLRLPDRPGMVAPV